MGQKRSDGVRRKADDAICRQKGEGRVRRFLAGLAVIVALGVTMPGWSGTSAVRADGALAGDLPQAGGNVFYRLEAGDAPDAGRVCPLPASGVAGDVVLAAATPGENEKLEEWREEGIRMAAELTGIPEAFFRWLQDKGVPVGEFMRFLMPFLQWIEMVDPHNGTKPSPKPAPAEQPRQTAV